MRSKRKLAVTGALVVALAGGVALVLPVPGEGGDAIAQPRRPAAPPAPARPKPSTDARPGARADAGPDVPLPDAGGPAPTASASAPAPSGSAPSVPPPPMGDGGARLSPLTPLPNEFPEGGPPAPAVDYDRLLADIASLRARVSAVSDSLFHSRLAVSIEASGSHAKIGRLAVSLDDGVVFTAPPGFRPSDSAPVYEHAVAPGRHALTIDVDRQDDRDESFRTSQRSRFVVDVPRDHRLELEVKIWDDSTMGDDFPGDRSGRYDLRVRVKANAKPVGR